MSPLVLVAAALAGGVGAALRYAVDVGVARITGARFPWGILVVNVSGSFALGLLAGSLPDVLFIVGTGLLGGYTTFSTAMLDTVALWRDGERPAAFGNALGTLLAAVAAAVAGLAVAATL